MNQHQQHKARAVLDYTLILLGNLLYASAVVMFIRPVDVIIGGVGGVAQMIEYLTGFLPMGVMVILLNLPLFLISFRQLGRQFLIRTTVATVASSLMIDFLTPVLSNVVITEDKLLSVLYGGVLMGLGLGLVFMRGATTGGSDIIAKMVTGKKPHISLGRVNLTVNAVVIAAAAFVYRSPEAALYAVVVQYVASSIIDMLLSGMDNASAALIVTSKPEEMAEAVLHEVQRGCTGLDGRGMYTNQAVTTLMIAARPHEVSRLKAAAHRVDPSSFMIFLNAREVLGLGFKVAGG
ncbi:MAG: YitT family protein [Oscillospiraceae bacterium]|nr:YitT family protein [Oscillospiraceae bacterium]